MDPAHHRRTGSAEQLSASGGFDLDGVPPPRAGEGFAACTPVQSPGQGPASRLMQVIPPRDGEGDHAKRGGRGCGTMTHRTARINSVDAATVVGGLGTSPATMLLRCSHVSLGTRSGVLAAKGSEPRTTHHAPTSDIAPEHARHDHPRPPGDPFAREPRPRQRRDLPAPRAAQRDQHAHAGRDHAGLRGARQGRQHQRDRRHRRGPRLHGRRRHQGIRRAERGRLRRFPDARQTYVRRDRGQPETGDRRGQRLRSRRRPRAGALLRHRPCREHRQDGPARDQARPRARAAAARNGASENSAATAPTIS